MKKLVYCGVIDDYKNKNTIWISWNITYKCNYNCHYCLIVNERNEKFNKDVYKDVIDYVDKKSKNYERVIFTWTGGDPSIINESDLIEMLQYMKEKLDSNKIIFRYQTNLSNSVNYYSNIWKILENFNIKISPTLHLTTDIDSFKYKINQMINVPIEMDIRVPIPYGYEEESIERYRDLESFDENSNIVVIPKYILEFDDIEPDYMKFILEENKKKIPKHGDYLLYDVIIYDDERDTYKKEKWNRDMFVYYLRDTRNNKYKKEYMLCDMSRNKEITPDNKIYKCPIDENITQDNYLCDKPYRICCNQVSKIDINHIEKVKEIINEC